MEECIIRNYSAVPKSDRLVLFSLSRILNSINYHLKLYEMFSNDKSTLEKTFLYIENCSIQIGYIWENLIFFKNHMYYFKGKYYQTIEENALYTKIKKYISDIAQEHSFICEVVKPIRNKYLFHFDDSLYSNEDAFFSMQDKVSLCSSESKILSDSYFNLPLSVFKKYVDISCENGYIKNYSIFEFFNKIVAITTELQQMDYLILENITKGKYFKEEIQKDC